MPKLAKEQEIIFCDDKSTDGTVAEVLKCQVDFPEKNIRLLHGPGISKARNVWTGFDGAKFDILVILDADLTVLPEDLWRYTQALVEGHGRLINGTRFLYPMEKNAMKPLNWLGNRIFSAMFSFVLKQRITDTLCGTKVIWKKDWDRLKPLIGTWGFEDRWGDYELLLGASNLDLRIVDMPIHYHERVFGQTKMVNVFKNGCIMFGIILSAFFKLRKGDGVES
jgi:glycosyltransferase involved in cell wall biosynthesis